jgi:hypothetical protein
VKILDAIELPRGAHVRGPFIEAVGNGWAGRKAPDCRIVFDIDAFHSLEGVQRADSLLKTWFHESVHGRRPYAPGFAEEWRLYRGFEEGLAEGLARVIAHRLGLQPLLASYNYYVVAYQTLASVLDVPVDEIWRGLWEYSAGEVALGFSEVIAGIMVRYGMAPQSRFQRARLFARARNLFSTQNTVQSPDGHVLLDQWREVLT